MKKTTLHILDEVNCKFEGLDISTRRKLSNEVKFILPYARHLPAVKLGRWDGSVRFCDIGARTYINVLDRLLPVVEQAGYSVEIQDHREPHQFEFEAIDENSYSHIKWPEGHRFAGQGIQVMDHQVEAINQYLEHPQSIQCLSTAAGKTLITGILSHKVEPYGRSIVIVPSQDLVTQTESMYKHMGLDVGVFYGGRKDLNCTHTICTWQSLEVLNKKSKQYDPEFDIREFIDGVVCVMVDEAHGLKAEVLKKLMTTVFANIPIRWAMTGTIPKEEAEGMSLIATVGPVTNTVRAQELQEKGILANLHIKILQLDEPPLTFKDYAAEYKHVTSEPNRLDWLAGHISTTAETGNTLILVNRIDTGKHLHAAIPDSVFISGSMKSRDRKEEYREVHSSENKVIIATYGVAAVGIDIPRIFNLYLFEPGKSFIRVIQSIGRGIRKAEDKDFVNIYDVCCTFKYSKKHLTDRKRYYREQGYPHTVRKVRYQQGDSGHDAD